MYSIYQAREELEDDLYQEDDGDSEGSEANSEMEFHLYSQLHYSSNPGEVEEQEDEEEKEQDSQQQEVTEKTPDGGGELEHTKEGKPLSPVNGKLRQHPMKKKLKEKKQCKQKKKKSDPKGQKSSSLSFEEVIVIDSSPEVISISEEDSEEDTTDDDEGICALKGQGLHQLQTSTPVQQETQKRKRSLGVPVTVDSSSSETDSEESESESESDSSDSDGLENWMILGREMQDGDQSISLNLEGGPDNSSDDGEQGEEGTWLISDKDKEAQVYNKDKGARTAVQRVSVRYYTAKNVHCRNCNKIGHFSKSCPQPKKLLPCFLCGTPGHLASECPNKHCNNCGLPGHGYDSCSERAYWHKQCHRCSMTGHFLDACPEVWRQYHITTKTGPPVKWQGRNSRLTYCYNCSKKGHFGHACTQRRMFNRVYPCTTLINHYDTVKDINRRQHRINLKVKELKTNGYFLAPSQSPVTPKLPKKKQKISHHTNNHQPNHTPRQISNNHKPSPSHIFFNDSDFSAATPKKSKLSKCKQQHNAGSVKPWKPKRPVPKTRDPLPPAKVILDEAADFPRGGGTGENMEEKKRRRRMNKKKQIPLRLSEDRRPDLSGTVRGKKQWPESKQQKGEKKKKRKNQACRFANKKLGAEMYPTDENLFIIKQRKRSR